MRIILFVIICLALPVSIFSQELYPTDILPTESLDESNVLRGGEYQLEFKPLEPESDPTETGTDSLTSRERAEFETNGYLIRPSYLSPESSNTRETYEGGITLSIQNRRLDFGTIAGTVEREQETHLGVTAQETFGYQLLAIQETPFQSAAKTSIPPINCTRTDCRQSYGFGYTVGDSAAYRQFTLRAPVVLATHKTVTGLSSTSLTFRLFTPANTPEGTYGMDISIIAIPKL